MSRRLQVLIDEKEYGLLAKAAKQSGLSLGEWVRIQLRNSLAERPERDSDKKMAKILELSRQHGFPSGEIQDIKDQIESGYLKK